MLFLKPDVKLFVLFDLVYVLIASNLIFDLGLSV